MRDWFVRLESPHEIAVEGLETIEMNTTLWQGNMKPEKSERVDVGVYAVSDICYDADDVGHIA